MMAHESVNSKGRSPSLIWCLLLMLIVTILFKLITPWLQLHGNSRYAGPSRGDIRVAANVLPESLGDWKVVGFTEPSEADVVGIVGWSHSWIMQRGQRQVIISFDQVGFMGWHELTDCYKAAGWQIERHEVQASDPAADPTDWPYVSVRLTKSSGEMAMLLYSIFNGEGQFRIPPDHGVGSQKSSGILNRLDGNRSDGLLRTAESSRCLQVQILVPFVTAIPEDLVADARELHLLTRRLFRDHWLKLHLSGIGVNESSKISEE